MESQSQYGYWCPLERREGCRRSSSNCRKSRSCRRLTSLHDSGVTQLSLKNATVPQEERLRFFIIISFILSPRWLHWPSHCIRSQRCPPWHLTLWRRLLHLFFFLLQIFLSLHSFWLLLQTVYPSLNAQHRARNVRLNAQQMLAQI